MIYEVCIDSVEGVIAAQTGGAQRVELCDNLVEGGTTPSLGMIRMVCRHAALAVNVLIRPRGGDFCYSALEFDVMCQDINAAKEAGANGLVFGLLLADGSVDVDRTRTLVELARPLPVTFHRAIDVCRSANLALEALIGLGVQRVLTSGGRASALEGAADIARLVRQAGERIVIMAGGGITAENLPELVTTTGVREVHFNARETVESPMEFRNPEVLMGKPYQPNEYILRKTAVERIRRVVEAVP